DHGNALIDPANAVLGRLLGVPSEHEDRLAAPVSGLPTVAAALPLPTQLPNPAVLIDRPVVGNLRVLAPGVHQPVVAEPLSRSRLRRSTNRPRLPGVMQVDFRLVPLDRGSLVLG